MLKMADQELSDFSLRASATNNVNNFVIWNCTSLESVSGTYKSNLKMTGESEFSYLNKQKS